VIGKKSLSEKGGFGATTYSVRNTIIGLMRVALRAGRSILRSFYDPESGSRNSRSRDTIARHQAVRWPA